MSFQDFLLAVLERTLSRATGLIYLAIGAAISLVEYLQANPKPEYFLTNSVGNLLVYVGVATVAVRSIEKRKHAFEASRKAKSEIKAQQDKLAQSALANYPIMDDILQGALKKQIQLGKQRFHVMKPNRLLHELQKMNVVVTPLELGEKRTQDVYVIHPAVWDKRDEILNNGIKTDQFYDHLFENRRV